MKNENAIKEKDIEPEVEVEPLVEDSDKDVPAETNPIEILEPKEIENINIEKENAVEKTKTDKEKTSKEKTEKKSNNGKSKGN